MGKLRGNAKRGVMIASIVAVLACVGLFVRAYEAAAPTPDAAAPTGGAASGTPQPSPSVASTARTTPKVDNLRPSSLTTLPPYTISPGIQRGFTIAPATTYPLVMSVTSPRPVAGVGYLVPTSPDHSYGTAKHIGRHWSVHTSVTGTPYYAAVFVQADATGTPITCSIAINGVVKSTKTTSGPFGRQVCVA